MALHTTTTATMVRNCNFTRDIINEIIMEVTFTDFGLMQILLIVVTYSNIGPCFVQLVKNVAVDGIIISLIVDARIIFPHFDFEMFSINIKCSVATFKGMEDKKSLIIIIIIITIVNIAIIIIAISGITHWASVVLATTTLAYLLINNLISLKTLQFFLLQSILSLKELTIKIYLPSELIEMKRDWS
jgi:hypothetical protein